MRELLTQNIQDYLKHIYALTEGGGAASTNDLAARLGIRRGLVFWRWPETAPDTPA